MSRLLKLKRQVITEANKRVLNEQDDFYVEEIKPYLDKGYKEVDKIDLSDDTYYKDGGSHSFSVIDKWGNYTGYDIITTFGVKGRYSKDDGFEIIGGASFVHRLLRLCPDLNIVLVRTTGLWGSQFSRAITGISPNFGQILRRCAKLLCKSGFFFMPKRKVKVEFSLPPLDFPVAKSLVFL